MISGYEKITSRRVWFVPNFVVWGLPPLETIHYLTQQLVGSTRSVFYGSTLISDGEQEVSFDSLIDHRGNNLPSGVKSPRVFPRAKSDYEAFVIGRESSEKFKIAHTSDTAAPISVDLLIMEMGD